MNEVSNIVISQIVPLEIIDLTIIIFTHYYVHKVDQGKMETGAIRTNLLQ